MAILFVDSLSKTNNRVIFTAVRAIELMLLSAGLVSTLIMVKKGAIIPYSCELVFTSLIGFWNSIKCFFSSPLHICIIINFIVALIALSSTFHSHEKTNQDDDIRVDNIDVCVSENLKTPPRDITVVEQPPPPPPPAPPPQPPQDVVIEEVVEEKDTIEATWKSITGGGKQRTKKKQLKKSETWDVPPRASVNMRRLDSEEVMPSSPKWKELRKSETFNDALSITRRGGLIRRIPSMSMDDFNKKVEAFIKKGMDNIKLQRQ